MDVCLAYMPYGPLEPPPLGVSLLAGGARRAGLAVRTLYPSFRFSDRIGLFVYRAISEAIGGFQIAEWTFSRLAFPDFSPDDAFLNEYIEWERTRDPEKFDLLFRDRGAFLQTISGIRAAAEAFIDEIAREIAELEPKIVGCSSTYYQNCASLALLRRLKELRPDTITMMGGANCESTMGIVMKRAFRWVDVVVSGEADELFVPLCRKLLDRGPDALLERLPAGVITASSLREDVPAEAPVAMTADLNLLPVPDFDDYFDARAEFSYQAALAPVSLSIETSRGCWWGRRRQCAFCGGNGERISYRAKTAERVMEELRKLSDQYFINRFVAADNILDMSYFATLLRDLAATNPPPYSVFLSVASNLSEEQCTRLADAGVHRMQPGIESLDDRLLAVLNKGNTAIGNVALLKFAFECGIKTTWNILVDIPGEEDEWYREMASWLPLISHLQPPHKVMSIHFERFSPYHRDQSRYGLSLVPHRWYSRIYPLTPTEMQDFAYHFENRCAVPMEETSGRRALDAQVLDWMLSHSRSNSGEARPMLTVREETERSLIRDTRACAVASEVVLEGLSDTIHRACRSPRALEAICTMVGSVKTGQDVSGSVTEALERLCEQGLILKLGRQYLALAVREPLRPFVYPPDYSYPRWQALVNKSGRSYWEIMAALDRRVAAQQVSELFS